MLAEDKIAASLDQRNLDVTFEMKELDIHLRSYG